MIKKSSFAQGRWIAFTLIILGFFLLVLRSYSNYKTVLEKAGVGSLLEGRGRLSSAVAIYYGDHKGQWPETLEALIPKYVEEIPKAGADGSNKVVTKFDGTGGWVYDKQSGRVFPNVPLPKSDS